MLNIDDTLQQRLTQQIGRIEAATGAELVLVLAGSSGSYTDIPWRAALIAGAAALAFLCWSPWSFSDLAIPLDTGAAALLAGLIAWRQPRSWRWALSAARAERQVREAAAAAFHREAVHATAERVGLLVYISAFEGRAEILPDQGLLGKISGADRAALSLPPIASAADLEAGLDRIGAVLARHVPRASDDRNELPDAPRVYR